MTRIATTNMNKSTAKDLIVLMEIAQACLTNSLISAIFREEEKEAAKRAIAFLRELISTVE